MKSRDVKTALYKEAASVTKALANPHRLEILDLLAQGAVSVEYIAEQTRMPVANASQHLQVLRKAGIAVVERRGKYSFYRLAGRQVYDVWHSLRNLGFAQNRQAQELLDSYHRERTDLRILPAREFAQKLGNEKLIILDVRPDEEYQISHIRGAISMQADRIHDYLETVPDGAEIVAYCRGPMCMMADTVVQQLNQRGHQAWRLDIGVAECAYYGIAVDHDPEQGCLESPASSELNDQQSAMPAQVTSVAADAAPTESFLQQNKTIDQHNNMENVMEHTILVLGGGIGGLCAARELSAQLGNEDDARVARILVFEKEQKSTYSPSLTWLMVGKRKEWQIERELSSTSGAGIEFIFGQIEHVDPAELTVTSAGTTYKGTHMVVSLGVQQVIEQKLDTFGHNFYTIDGAKNFHDNLIHYKGGNLVVMVSSLPYKSPVAPYEAAMLLDSYLREHDIRDASTITLVTPEDEPMPFAGDEVTRNIVELMKERGITYLPGHHFSSASEGKLTFTTSDGNTAEVPFDLLAFTPKHEAPQVIREAGLTGESGWVEVDRQSLKTGFENVYAIGDITTIPLDGNEKLPKAGVFAQFQAHIVAHHITRGIYGKTPEKVFDAEGNYILDLGDGKARKVGGNFYDDEVNINNAGVMTQWMKQLQEKSWFAKNF
ncbi:MAG: bifunctional enzyme with rhodanese and NADH/FAD dehydrogenase domains / ArsR family transcriptional [Bacteroidetes bacterium HLUCCA01]|nr:MAG: bifunctional enzyme with rhodanese and NADH/FAD dehydrogenase domains / ArsR family transcriptional [Bacteroidetes bacterium HLUCCA01]